MCSIQCSLGEMGLENLGNTCYMNASLQALSSLECLKEYFLNKTFEQSDDSLSRHFGDLMKAKWDTKGGKIEAYEPFSLYSYMLTRPGQNDFKQGRMACSYECTMVLLRGLIEENAKLAPYFCFVPLYNANYQDVLPQIDLKDQQFEIDLDTVGDEKKDIIPQEMVKSGILYHLTPGAKLVHIPQVIIVYLSIYDDRGKLRLRNRIDRRSFDLKSLCDERVPGATSKFALKAWSTFSGLHWTAICENAGTLISYNDEKTARESKPPKEERGPPSVLFYER